MSTSDPSQLTLTPDTMRERERALPFSGTMPTGALDTVMLARMANEFFTALPGSFDVPVSAVPTDVQPSSPLLASVPATIPAAQPEIQLPSDQHFPSLPASIGPASVSPVSAPMQATPPAAPGVVGTAASQGSTGVPAFSFMEDARPLFTEQISSAGSPYPQAQPIAEFLPLVAAPDTISPAQSLIVGPTAQSPAPAVPDFAGTPANVPFLFLEELRPLSSYSPAIPVRVPSTATSVPTSDVLPFDLQLPHDFVRAPEVSDLTGGASFGFLEGTRALYPSETVDKHHHPLEINRDLPRDPNLSSDGFSAEAVKRDFPILRERVNGRPLVWLDNAATTQKPQSVIDRLAYFYEHENSNVHRAAHELAARATDAYEGAREKVRRFLNASSTREIIFVRGATEGINLIAQSWGRRNIQKDDEIVITWLEHHANIVPWQMLCSEKGAKLRVAPVDDSGQIILEEYEKLLGPKTRLVSITQVSNALGVVTPARVMTEIAHRYGAKVLLDGAQSVSHMRVDMQALDCDFFVFSGHKVFGPTGIGVVYGKPNVLENMPPWQGGGNMIQDVTFEKTTYHGPPQRFEAGTGNIADAVGLGAAIDYLDRVGMPNISRHEHELLVYTTNELVRIPGLHIIGSAKEKAGVISFVLDGFRTEEVGDHLNKNGIAVRSGHHCAQPILRRFGQENTVRASLALYNTYEDIDRLIAALWDLRLGRNSIA